MPARCTCWARRGWQAITHHAGALGARVVFVDSIQTTYTDELESAPGNVARCGSAQPGHALRQGGGASGAAVGHVTKGGGHAGPKTLEHIVDTVLYFEGESTLDHRSCAREETGSAL